MPLPGPRIAVALALAALAVAPPAAQQFRSGVDVVHFPVVVTGRDGLVTGLTRDDFVVLEEGKAQEIQYFSAGDGEDGALARLPFHLGLLLDASGSMGADMAFARTAAIKFINELDEAEDVTVVDFDTEVRVARYEPADWARMIERIRGRKPDGWTALYDAVGMYMQSAASQTGQKVLLLYTDGGDTRSQMNFSDVISLLRMVDVTVYAIGFLEHQPQSVRMEQRMRLSQIAAEAGGEAYFPTSREQLEEVYAKILGELRGRYTLGYIPSDPRTDGTWRKVEVKLKSTPRGVKVRTRDGYYAPYVEKSR